MVGKNTPLYGKKTVIVGARTNRSGYAALAFDRLIEGQHEVVLLGKEKSSFEGKEILDIHDMPAISEVDTITLYINPGDQKPWIHYFIGLNPARIIFNPGTENSELRMLAEEKGIETVYGCTLVMLSIGVY